MSESRQTSESTSRVCAPFHLAEQSAKWILWMIVTTPHAITSIIELDRRSMMTKKDNLYMELAFTCERKDSRPTGPHLSSLVPAMFLSLSAIAARSMTVIQRCVCPFWMTLRVYIFIHISLAHADRTPSAPFRLSDYLLMHPSLPFRKSGLLSTCADFSTKSCHLITEDGKIRWPSQHWHRSCDGSECGSPFAK